jgi:hypothetical protein
VNPKEIKCVFQWWRKDKTMFLIVDFLAHQVLGIIRSQTKIDMILFPNIFTNLRKEVDISGKKLTK